MTALLQQQTYRKWQKSYLHINKRSLNQREYCSTYCNNPGLSTDKTIQAIHALSNRFCCNCYCTATIMCRQDSGKRHKRNVVLECQEKIRILCLLVAFILRYKRAHFLRKTSSNSRHAHEKKKERENFWATTECISWRKRRKIWRLKRDNLIDRFFRCRACVAPEIKLVLDGRSKSDDKQKRRHKDW